MLSSYAHGTPTENLRSDKVLRRVIGHVNACRTAKAKSLFDDFEGSRVGLAEIGAEFRSVDDGVHPIRETERLNLISLTHRGAVCDRGHRDLATQFVEECQRIG